MTLTSHLKDTESPVRQFIYSCAPGLALAGTRGPEGHAWAARFGFDELTLLETQIPIPTEVKLAKQSSHATLAGMALDYRIRMDLPGFDIATTTAREGLDRLGRDLEAVHRGKHIHRVLHDAAMGASYLMLQETNPHPLSLARAAVPLAWCEAIYRIGPVMALSNDTGKQIKRAKDFSDLMMSIDEPLLLDIARMHNPLREVLGQWSQEVAEGADFTPNPTFLGSRFVGGADGDLIFDGVLVEVKTRETITNPWLRESLFQLLGYVLLDIDDAHRIRDVAIMLPRQPHMRHWSVDELLGKDAEQALPELRDAFARLLVDMKVERLPAE